MPPFQQNSLETILRSLKLGQLLGEDRRFLDNFLFFFIKFGFIVRKESMVVCCLLSITVQVGGNLMLGAYCLINTSSS